MDVADELRQRLWFLEEENKGLRGQVEALTRERDDLAGIVWGKIRGAAPSLNMGGQPAPQTACAMCGGDCTGHRPNFAYGVRYCDKCAARYTDEHILEHARGVMASGGSAVVNKNGQPIHAQAKAPAMPPIAHPPVAVRNGKPFDPNTTDTQVVNRDEWDAWVAAVSQQGQNA